MTKKKNRKKLLYKNRYLYAMMFFPVVYFVLFKYKPHGRADGGSEEKEHGKPPHAPGS